MMRQEVGEGQLPSITARRRRTGGTVGEGAGFAEADYFFLCRGGDMQGAGM